ncbi:hypothetical protein BUALT_Bualt05G0167900 [Buddleja alternifolia]|uniref:EF-hand domain-containing protein n=1 Tax=Buddleja alternifolia TaxID=168488 RepID=A0AAV6XLU2_9LAMI|nr:hypothetical protein BUALT_Bualt05G0167900 [Buddleja alternifolia]
MNSELIFNLFDEDKDGKITPLQLQNCISMIGGGLSVKEAETVAEGLISDEDGLVALGEFVNLVDISRKFWKANTSIVSRKQNHLLYLDQILAESGAERQGNVDV